jgi:hypothetical protein
MDTGMGMANAEIDQETRGKTGSALCIGFFGFFFKGLSPTGQESLPRGRWAHCTAKNQYRKFENFLLVILLHVCSRYSLPMPADGGEGAK